MLTRLLLLTFVVIAIQSQDESATENKATPELGRVTKEMLATKFQEEKRRLAESFKYVNKVTRGLVEMMKDHARLVLLKQLQQQVERSVEAAEDSLVAAEERGVVADSCVAPLEDAARKLGQDAIERLRECVEAEAAEGRRLQEMVADAVVVAAPLLDELDAALKECFERQDETTPDAEAIEACFAEDSVQKSFAAQNNAMYAVGQANDVVREKEKASNDCLAVVFHDVVAEFDALRAAMSTCVEVDRAPRAEL